MNADALNTPMNNVAAARPLASAIYEGQVRHRRFPHAGAPVAHHFDYRLFMMYVDLDEVERLCALSPFWSARRFAPAWFRRADFLPSRPGTLRAAALAVLAEQGIDATGIGPIRLLTHLRYWGLSFNPVSLYYCYAGDGVTLRHVICEVHNTPWNERHCYVLAVDGNDWHQHELAKSFHVSPFLPVDMQYRFRFNAPGEQLGFHLENHRAGERCFDATLSLHRQPVTAAALNRVLWRYPWMTVQVVAGIYAQAFRLWRKGVVFHPHP